MRAQGDRIAGGRIAGRGAARLWIVLFAIWAAANASFDSVVLGVGAVITGGIALALTRGPTLWDGLRTGPRAIWAFLGYTVIFMREMVRSNMAMLRIVYAPRIDICPAIVPTRTRLTTPMGRFVLSNTVTLTPGSLVMGLQGDTLTVHLLDQDTTDIDINTAKVSGAFDLTLERAFG